MLGGYQLVQRLSEGASAEVFLARPEDTEERVIVEVIRPELFQETELVARFLDEVQARKALTHPNVARRVLEGTAADGRPFLVSESLGENLHQRLARIGPLDPEQLLKLAIPVCDALHYLHQRGMVHGNLTPSAVYLGSEGMPQRPKLIDYGLALFRPGRTMPRPEGRILVDPAYLSPERIRGQRARVSCDLYALGVLLYEALRGEPPFRGTSVEVRKAHLFEPPRPLPPGCEALWPLIERCLQKAPDDRFPSALAVREALAAQLDGTLPLPPPLMTLSSATSEGGSFGARTCGLLPDRGDKVGRYTLLEAIGEGAMGRVFLARHTRLGRTVALKLLKPEHSHNREQVERFVREARAVNRIRNEHIVEIFDLVDEELPQGGRRVYCVMELLHGQNLGDTLAKGPLPLARSLNIVRQVATALDAAHHAGVVHRDIKPDNVFLLERSGDEFAKVVDFGVAKLREGTDIAGAATIEPAPSSLSQTAAGTVVGTPTYMAPEQVLGHPIDPRVDVYALGTVLYKLVAGRTPFSAPDFAELSQKIAFEAPPQVPSIAASGELVPPALATLVRECLEKDPAQRPQSAAEVASRLEAIGEVLQKPSPSMARPRPPLPKRLWVAFGASASIAVSALAVIAVGALPLPFTRAEPEVTVVHGEPGIAEAAEVKLMLYSEPPFAVVTRLDTGERLGRTPVQLILPKADEPLALRFEHTRYRPVELYVERGADASAHVVLRPDTRRKKKAKGRASLEAVRPDTPGPAPLRQ